MVKRFELNKAYSLHLVVTDKNGDPFTWTENAYYKGRDKDGNKIFKNGLCGDLQFSVDAKNNAVMTNRDGKPAKKSAYVANITKGYTW